MRLISYTGKFPVEVYLSSGTLTLRQNTTAMVSEPDLAKVKEALGERAFNRLIIDHGEHGQKKEKLKESKKEDLPTLPVFPLEVKCGSLADESSLMVADLVPRKKRGKKRKSKKGE